MKHHVVLSVLFFRDEAADAWVAQALERNIAAYGPTLEAAKIAFERTVVGHFQLDAKYKRPPLAALSPAADVFWTAWERVRKSKMEAEELPTIPAYMIPAITSERIQTVQ